ncbi:inosine-5'-monophosphate dehydrogenase [Methanobrevibacter cuticularis]|uniref:Inosine-5'-monophosphate dehydrogenase n=1 Tax=Methanobrevibacter cuticularis TaxID=47311 RepID=A0A166D3U4_9EURY|nr:CBS domain-containing protein [Methanobrevibacter cuticularis]KZX15172.1 inosine-5'-monophosphate dehydrogenase [Methanobrevibacter cuticularis]
MLIKDIVSEEVVHVSVPGNREKALELMRKKKVSGLPVTKEGTKKLVGILTRSDLIENPDEEQIALIMSRDIVVADLNDDVKDVARKMIDNNIRRMPVVKDGDLIGIVTSFDLVALAISEMDIQDPVGDYMTKSVPTTWEKTPLNVAFEIMRLYNLKCVVALNNDSKMSGILTETDFINESEVVSETSVHNSTVGTEGDKWSWDSTSVLYVEKNHLKFSDKLVKDVSSITVSTANTKTKVSDCAKKMRVDNIEQIPITGIEGELIGLLRANDLIKAIIK